LQRPRAALPSPLAATGTEAATAISTEPGGRDRNHRVPAGTWLTA
jgi:hypothetical protein